MRIAIRMLAKTPGLSLSAIALLAIGIGGGTLLFSAFEAVWLRALPAPHPEQLVRMVQDAPRLGRRSAFDYDDYKAIKTRSTTLAAVFAETDYLVVAMSEPAPAEQVRVNLVTPEFFQELGGHALYGRTPEANDSGAVVLSYGFWTRRFHADRAVIGRKIVLHGFPFTIVGIMPREFNGLSADNTPDLRAPVSAIDQLARYEGPNAVAPKAHITDFQVALAGRLKPGVTLAQAQAECFSIWRSMVEKTSFAAVELQRPLQLESLARGVSIVREKFGVAVRLIAAASGVLLLLVCANVAGLMLAGAASRRSEIAVRLALGATRGRLIRQMLTESLLLVAMGTATGWALAWICAPLLVHALPPIRDLATTRLEISLDFRPDARVLLVAFAAAAATAVLVGLVPAIAASRTNLDAVLRGIRASHAWGGRKALVIVQVALCTVLLAGAGLLVRTLRELQTVDVGLDVPHIVTFTTDPGLMGYVPAQSRVLWMNLAARVRDLPGVVSVAESARPLMRGSGFKGTFAPAGETVPTSDYLNTSMNNITPGYFDAMGMRIGRGRALASTDIGAPKPVPAVVNEAFVRRFFPDTQQPLGKLFGQAVDVAAKPERIIVGVVKDAKYRGLREPMTPTVYTVSEGGFSVLAVRTYGAPEALIEPVRKALASLDPALPFTEIHTMTEEVEASVAPERLTAKLAATFGAFASFLAAAGIYGLLAFAVEQRRREIGIRMALGARPGQIGTMLGREAAMLLAAGLAAGLAATLLLASSLRALLYGIAPTDPVSMAAAAVLMISVGAAATLIPARRATGIAPAAALRE